MQQAMHAEVKQSKFQKELQWIDQMYYDSLVYEGDPDQSNDYEEPEEKEKEEYDDEDEQIDSGSKTKDSLFSQMSREGKSMDTKSIFEQMLLESQ